MNSVKYNTVVGAIILALPTEGSLHNIFIPIFVDMASNFTIWSKN
jgi:hypothetical protein